MNLLIDMPKSTFSLSAEDDPRIMDKVRKAFTAKLRIFNSFGPPTIDYLPLVTAKDDTHFEIRTGLLPKFRQLLAAEGVALHEMDVRKKPMPDPDLCKTGPELRDYQQTAVN